MFKCKNKQYEFKFNADRLKVIEGATKRGIMAEFYSQNGMFGLQTVEACFQFTLKEAGSDSYVPQEEAVNVCENTLKELGYAKTVLEIQEALKADMPFLFQ